MRKREKDEMFERLSALKNEILKAIADSSGNIDALNALSSSEEGDISSAMSIANVDTSALNASTRTLREIEAALEKLKNGVYGRCEMCKENIDVRRLRVKPHARFCIECRAVFEDSQKSMKRMFDE